MSDSGGGNVDVEHSDTLTSLDGSQDQGHTVHSGPVKAEDTDQRQNGQEEMDNIYHLHSDLHTAFHMGEEVGVEGKIVRQLSEGFLNRFLPSLQTAQTSVAEILNNQTVVMETLEQENAKFRDCTAHTHLSDMMTRARQYHNKLLIIKRDMVSLHDKAAKLKRRALKLQQAKQKEELERAHQQERQLEKDHMLTAKVASPQS